MHLPEHNSHPILPAMDARTANDPVRVIFILFPLANLPPLELLRYLARLLNTLT